MQDWKVQAMEYRDVDKAAQRDAEIRLGSPATHAEAVRIMRQDGHTHMLTYAGPVPLADWTPYGNGIEATWRGVLRGDGKWMDDMGDKARPDDCLGVWTPCKPA